MSDYDVQDFQTEVIERSAELPVVADFWAAWCGPCKVLGPVLERLAGEAGGRWRLAKIDTDAYPRIAAEYGIRSIPAVKLFVDGQVASEFVGALPEESIRQWLAEAVPGPQSGALRAARTLLAGGRAEDVEQARGLLEEVLRDDAGNQEARLLLAETLVFDDPAAATALVEPIGSGAKHGDSAAALRTVARLLQIPDNGDGLAASSARDAYLEALAALSRRDFDAALSGFIDVAGRDRALDDDGARNACLAIFTLLGDDAELTREYRKRLARALFV